MKRCLGFMTVIFAGLYFYQISPAIASSDLITVTNAWIRAMPPSFKHTAAYLTIKNGTSEEIKLIGVETDAAATGELHTMDLANGQMKMKQIDHIMVQKNDFIDLKPEGQHIMLIGLNRPLNEGDKVDLILIFDKDVKKELLVEVMKSGRENEESMHHGTSMKGNKHHDH